MDKDKLINSLGVVLNAHYRDKVISQGTFTEQRLLMMALSTLSDYVTELQEPETEEEVDSD